MSGVDRTMNEEQLLDEVTQLACRAPVHEAIAIVRHFNTVLMTVREQEKTIHSQQVLIAMRDSDVRAWKHSEGLLKGSIDVLTREYLQVCQNAEDLSKSNERALRHIRDLEEMLLEAKK
jgi:hypothetical protein